MYHIEIVYIVVLDNFLYQSNFCCKTIHIKTAILQSGEAEIFSNVAEKYTGFVSLTVLDLKVLPIKLMIFSFIISHLSLNVFNHYVQTGMEGRSLVITYQHAQSSVLKGSTGYNCHAGTYKRPPHLQ